MKILLASLALCFLAPSAQATSQIIVVTNHSSYMPKISYTTLYKYLKVINNSYDTYQGVYWIYLDDKLPSKIIFPSNSLGGHTNDVRAYINVKGSIDAGLDPYLVITHEIAEMAVNPHLLTGVEIADNSTNSFIIQGHVVSGFKERI